MPEHRYSYLGERLPVRPVYEKSRCTAGFEGFDQGASQVSEDLNAARNLSPEYVAMKAEKQERAKQEKCRREEREKRDVAKQHRVPPSAITLRGDQDYTIHTEGRVVNRGKNRHLRRIAVPQRASTLYKIIDPLLLLLLRNLLPNSRPAKGPNLPRKARRRLQMLVRILQPQRLLKRLVVHVSLWLRGFKLTRRPAGM